MTSRQKILTLAAVMGALVTAAGLSSVAARAQTDRLEWRVEDEHAADGTVELTLTQWRGPASRSSYGRNVQIGELQGLTREQLAGSAMHDVRFVVVREAGTFSCQGSAVHEAGSGVCEFRASDAFRQRLRSNGSGEADDGQMLQLAMANIGGAYLDELKRQKYATASVAEIVRGAQHGVNLKYLQEMGAAGYRLPDVGALADLRDHGVSATFIAALKEAGYTGLPIDLITRLRDHGVGADYIKGMAALGYRNIAPEDLVRLRDHGVSVSFAAAVKDEGYANVTAEDLTRLRDHGVSASYIRRVNADGPKLDVDDIIRLRDRGEYPRERAER